MVIDPSALYASGIRTALPGVAIAVDKWHLVALANPDGHRGKATRHPRPARPPRHRRRPGVGEPAAAADRRGPPLDQTMATPQRHAVPRCEPSNEIGAAWGVKERLRMLLAELEPARIRRRLADIYEAAIDAQLPEATRLARTIDTWWPAVLVALTHNVSNARTEGFNRIIKQVKCVGCGYRNMINYQRRVLSHIAVTLPQRQAA